eukprot:gene68-4317_t
MNTRLSILLLFTFCFTALFAQFPNCGVDTDDGRIELSGLFRPGGEYTGTDGFDDFHINVCGNAVTQCDGQNYPAISQAHGNCYPLGSNRFDVELLERSNPKGGSRITYHDGTVGGIPAKTEIDMLCDEAVSTPRFEYHSNRFENDMFIINFRITAKQVCPGMGGTGAFGGYYPPLWPVGFGGLGLILTIVGFILYCIIGALVNKFKWKMEGLFIIPNWPFWKVLPFLFKDGIMFMIQGFKTLFNMIRSKIKGESYEQLE